MSFMPDPGTIVRLTDGRIAIVSQVTPEGDADRVLLQDGHEESIDAWSICELLTDDTEVVDRSSVALLRALRSYLECQ